MSAVRKASLRAVLVWVACSISAVLVVSTQCVSLQTQQDSVGAAFPPPGGSALGTVVGLADPRFEPENGRKGLWRRWDFISDVGPGIYFLEECDTERTPVLFIHGMAGNPREFEALVEHLDHDRFQAWFYYYPSGASLDQLSDQLSRDVIDLRAECGFQELFVVGHSIGGLLARSFILKHYARTHRKDVTLFVSISTPWGGHRAARRLWLVPSRLGLPASFRDVAPDSEFIDGLFFEDADTTRMRRRLPTHVSYHMLYGYRREDARSGPSGDGVVNLSSGTRLEAQEEASSQRALDYGHADILQSAEAAEFLRETLAQAIRKGASGRGLAAGPPAR